MSNLDVQNSEHVPPRDELLQIQRQQVVLSNLMLEIHQLMKEIPGSEQEQIKIDKIRMALCTLLRVNDTQLEQMIATAGDISNIRQDHVRRRISIALAEAIFRGTQPGAVAHKYQWFISYLQATNTARSGEIYTSIPWHKRFFLPRI